MGWSKQARMAAALARKRKGGGRSAQRHMKSTQAPPDPHGVDKYFNPNERRSGGPLGHVTQHPTFNTKHTPDDLPALAAQYDSAISAAKQDPTPANMEKVRKSLEDIAGVKHAVYNHGLKHYKWSNAKTMADSAATTRFDLETLSPWSLSGKSIPSRNKKPFSSSERDAQKQHFLRLLDQLDGGKVHALSFHKQLTRRTKDKGGK